jgi:hypothetical protein
MAALFAAHGREVEGISKNRSYEDPREPTIFNSKKP